MAKKAILLFAILLGISGCNLASPPECLPTQDKCVNSEFGSGLYSVCNDKGEWGLPTTCKSLCEENTCKEFDNTRTCDEE